MRSLSVRCVAALIGMLSLVGTRAYADSPLSSDPTPLAVCQATIRWAGVELADGTRRHVSACLTRGIECIVGPASKEAACCDRAAERCAHDLQKVARAHVRFVNHVIRRRCATVPFEDVLAGLGYAGLAARCGGTPASLDDLVECLARLILSETACHIGTTELPRAADGFACLGIGETFIAETGADLASCAEETQPSASPTPVKTVTPLAIVTPVKTATAVRTTTPVVATATPLPIESGTATTTPAATATAIRSATSTPSSTGTPAITVVAATSTRTATPVATVTATLASTATPSVVATPTATPVVTATAILTATPVVTVTTTPGSTSTPIRTSTPVPTVTRTATPVPTVTVTPSGPMCGNGVKETGEDCDDGNTFDCDACPSNCKTAPADCTPATGGVRATQKVSMKRASGDPLTSANVCLSYPATAVGFPGTGGIPARISGFTGSNSLADFNNAAQIALLGRNALTEITLTVSFDLCTGQTAPALDAFSCRVVSASNAGASVDPLTVQCAAVAP